MFVWLWLGGCAVEEPDPTPVETDTEDTDADTDVEATLCEDGVPPLAFTSAASDPGLYAVAADFTLETRDGPWTLSEHWTGCDTYVFVLDEPRQAAGFDLYSRDVAPLLNRSPDNVHYFFLSNKTGAEKTASIDQVEQKVDAALDRQDSHGHWEGRLHFVNTRADRVEGWLGEVLDSPGWGVAIDRQQQIRYIGSFADQDRYSESLGWFEPNLSMAANEAVYYNF